MESVREDILPYALVMAQATEAILDHEVSKHPIFVLSKEQEELALGAPVTDVESEGLWRVKVSTLEEFVVKNINEASRVDDFRSIYKNPFEFYCLFVFTQEKAKFVFIPRNISEKE